MSIFYKVLVLVFIAMFFNHSYAQKSNDTSNSFSRIELLIDFDRKIVDNKIHITIYNRPKKTSEVYIRTQDLEETFKPWVRVKPDFRYKIAKPDGVVISDKILALDFKNFVKPTNSFGLHGYTCELRYGGSLNSIALKSWVPTNKTEQRQLTEYVAICNMILELAKMEDLKALTEIR